jgi:hypothetical protein
MQVMTSDAIKRPARDTHELPVNVPTDVPPGRASTGTVDDADEPEDEHDNENEASEREASDDTEAPEEFQHNDEDRTETDD